MLLHTPCTLSLVTYDRDRLCVRFDGAVDFFGSGTLATLRNFGIDGVGNNAAGLANGLRLRLSSDWATLTFCVFDDSACTPRPFAFISPLFDELSPECPLLLLGFVPLAIAISREIAATSSALRRALRC